MAFILWHVKTVYSCSCSQSYY